MSKEADASFESGSEDVPRTLASRELYAVLLLKQSESGDVPADSRAKQLLRDALALDPSLAEAHYQLGNLALKQGHMAEAQQHLERVAELDASNAQGHFALSRVYRRLGGNWKTLPTKMKLYEKLKGNRFAISTQLSSSARICNT